MIPDTEQTAVIFRKWRAKPRTVIAFFPEWSAGNGCIMSYEHVGQHGGASYPHPGTVPASPAEYADLQRELESLGYNLRILKRRPAHMEATC